MREANQIREDMEFRLSLFRLMTVPHLASADKEPGKPEGEEQLEQLFQLTNSGYRN